MTLEIPKLRGRARYTIDGPQSISHVTIKPMNGNDPGELIILMALTFDAHIGPKSAYI